MTLKLKKGTIERVFCHDYKNLFGGDLMQMIADLDNFVNSECAEKLVFSTLLDPMKEVSKVLVQLRDEYFKYDQSRFPNPIDQYLHIYESKEKIMAMVNRLEPVKPLEEIVLFTMFKRISWRIERVCDFIVKVGKTHYFELEELDDMLLPPENDDEMDPN